MSKGRKFSIGTEVVWLHEPRGGWGYIFRIPAVVIGYGRCRVKIRAKKSDGTLAERFVKEESLRFGGL